MSFVLEEFTRLERERGDKLILCRVKTVRAGNSKYGLGSTEDIEKTQVPGYAISLKGNEGIALKGQTQRFDGSFVAYLNVNAGFDPKTITPDAYLMVNDMGMYELTLIETSRWGGKPIYYIYTLEETTESKALFDRFFRL